MPDGWEETIGGMPEEFVAALWKLGREWNALQRELDHRGAEILRLRKQVSDLEIQRG